MTNTSRNTGSNSTPYSQRQRKRRQRLTGCYTISERAGKAAGTEGVGGRQTVIGTKVIGQRQEPERVTRVAKEGDLNYIFSWR